MKKGPASTYIITTNVTYTWSFVTQTNFITQCCITGIITDVGRIQTQKMLVVICTDYTGNCKSNYHMITTTHT